MDGKPLSAFKADFQEALRAICRIRKRTRSMSTRCDCRKAAEALIFAYVAAVEAMPDLSESRWLGTIRDELLEEAANNGLFITFNVAE